MVRNLSFQCNCPCSSWRIEHRKRVRCDQQGKGSHRNPELFVRQTGGCGFWVRSAEGRACTATDYSAGTDGVGRALQDGLHLTCLVVSARLRSVPNAGHCKNNPNGLSARANCICTCALIGSHHEQLWAHTLSLMFSHISLGRRNSSVLPTVRWGSLARGYTMSDFGSI